MFVRRAIRKFCNSSWTTHYKGQSNSKWKRLTFVFPSALTAVVLVAGSWCYWTYRWKVWSHFVLRPGCTGLLNPGLSWLGLEEKKAYSNIKETLARRTRRRFQRR